jgi:G3E family GTPase
VSAASARLPVSIVGGYLGAGKTTLVNHLLREANGRRLAILVNDFGALPIDRDLIVAAGGDTIDIAGGCICCSYGSDLMAALQELLRRQSAIDHVVVETSGVALPGMVASAVTLLADYDVRGIVVVADAETVRARDADRYLADTIDRQLAAADLVLLNKGDLVPPQQLAETCDWLLAAAPDAELVVTTRCAIPPDRVLGRRPGSHRRPASLRTPGAPDAALLYATLTLALPGPVDVEAVARRLAAPELGLLRAKGFLRGQHGRLQALQVVGQRFEIDDAPASATEALTVIGLRGHLDKERISSLLDGAHRSADR